MKIFFSIDSQSIQRSDTEKIAANSKGILYAEFSFDHSWDELIKKAVFERKNKAYGCILNEGCCLVPEEVLGEGEFFLSVIGVDSEDSIRATTQAIKVNVEKGPMLSQENAPEPTPTEAEQLMSLAGEALETARAVKKELEEGEYAAVSEEKVSEAVTKYIKQNPISGTEGRSAYEIWLSQGNEGSEADFIAFLKGKDGTVQIPPLFAESVDWLNKNGDTTKVYILPDGYMYAYAETEAEGDELVPNFTNIKNNCILRKGKRYSLSGGGFKDAGGDSSVTVPVPGGADSVTVRLKGVTKSSGYEYIYGGASSETMTVELASWKSFSADSDGVYAVTLTKATDITYINFHINGATDDVFDNLIVTINEPIEYTPSTVITKGFASTGHTFVPADYEGRVIKLEEETSANKSRLNTHDLHLKNLENAGVSGEDNSIPAYWEDTIAEAESKIKALQNAGGADCLSFIWVSDTHCDTGSSASGNYSTAKNIGRLASRLMNDLDIPLLVVSGDLTVDVGSASTYPDKTDIDVFFDEIVKPVGKERVLSVLGNHDGATYRTDGDLNISKEARFNWFMRPFCTDFKRVWGGGEYYYADVSQAKARFICLCSNNGVSDIYRNACYDTAQLKWLAEEALDVPDGYTVIITTHYPPSVSSAYNSDTHANVINNKIFRYAGVLANGDVLAAILKAFANKTDYSDTVDGVSIAMNYTGNTGVMCAVFAGHIHKDVIATDIFDFPVITIDSAGNKSSETVVIDGVTIDNTPNKTFYADSSSETCFDVVTINKATGNIYMTRVGVGEDRSISY